MVLSHSRTSLSNLNRNAGCPILAAPLFLRLGWETKSSTRLLSTSQSAECPILAASLFLRLEWETGMHPQPLQA
jgi:hypothetical protein